MQLNEQIKMVTKEEELGKVGDEVALSPEFDMIRLKFVASFKELMILTKEIELYL